MSTKNKLKNLNSTDVCQLQAKGLRWNLDYTTVGNSVG